MKKLLFGLVLLVGTNCLAVCKDRSAYSYIESFERLEGTCGKFDSTIHLPGAICVVGNPNGKILKINLSENKCTITYTLVTEVEGGEAILSTTYTFNTEGTTATGFTQVFVPTCTGLYKVTFTKI